MGEVRGGKRAGGGQEWPGGPSDRGVSPGGYTRGKE